MENDFESGLIEKTLFIKTQGNDVLIVQFYDDDIYLDLLTFLLARNFLSYE